MKRSPGIVDAVESGTIRVARRADVEMEVIPTDQSGDVPCLFQWDERGRGREVGKPALWAQFAVEPLGIGRKGRRRKLETV